MSRLTLVSFATCPYVQRAMIVLKEKRVEFDVVYIDLANKPDWFLRMSPLGKVPVLKVQRVGKPAAIVFESMVIVEYLEEAVAGKRLHPSDPLEKALHRSWMEFGSGLQTDLYKVVAAADAAALAAAKVVVDGKFSRLEGAIAGPLFAGAAFCGVDAIFAPVFRQIDLAEQVSRTQEFAAFEKVTEWRAALAARPSVVEAVPADFAERFLGRLKAVGSFLLVAR